MTFEKTFVIIYPIVRGVAQLVARCVRDAKVVGSNPVASTKKGSAKKHCPFWSCGGSLEYTRYRGFVRGASANERNG